MPKPSDVLSGSDHTDDPFGQCVEPTPDRYGNDRHGAHNDAGRRRMISDAGS